MIIPAYQCMGCDSFWKSREVNLKTGQEGFIIRSVKVGCPTCHKTKILTGVVDV